LLETIQYREWGEYSSFDANELDENGSLTALLPDEMLVAIFAMLGDLKELANIARVCQRWRRIARDPRCARLVFPHIYTPHFNGLGLTTACDKAIRALDQGKIRGCSISPQGVVIHKWHVASKAGELLIAAVDAGGIWLWNGEGKTLRRIEQREVTSVQLSDSNLICKCDVEIRVYSIGELLSSIDFLSGQKTIICGEGTRFVDYAHPWVVCETASGARLTPTVRGKSSRVIKMRDLTTLRLQESFYLFGWSQSLTYICLNKNKIGCYLAKTYKAKQLQAIQYREGAEILRGGVFEDYVYCPIWFPQLNDQPASLQVAFFGQKIELGVEFQISEISECLDEVGIKRVGRERHVYAVVNETLIEWKWGEVRPLHTKFLARNEPVFSVTLFTENGIGTESHYGLVSGEPVGATLNGPLYLDAGFGRGRIVYLENKTLRSINPGLLDQAKINPNELHRLCHAIICDERLTLFFLDHYGQIVIFHSGDEGAIT
jgi:F-box-like